MNSRIPSWDPGEDVPDFAKIRVLLRSESRGYLEIVASFVGSNLSDMH